MPRPLWAGAISFGLVTIPVKVVSATEDHDVHFHRVHLADMGRVRTRKVCELDDQVVSQDEIGKGYEVGKEETVPVTDEELDAMPLSTAKAIEIAAFDDADSIDPVRISDSYYLAADGQVAAKPYALLRKALERSSKVAVAKFAWHGRERLGLLRVREGAIVLHSMKWPDEVRSPEPLPPRSGMHLYDGKCPCHAGSQRQVSLGSPGCRNGLAGDSGCRAFYPICRRSGPSRQCGSALSRCSWCSRWSASASCAGATGRPSAASSRLVARCPFSPCITLRESGPRRTPGCCGSQPRPVHGRPRMWKWKHIPCWHRCGRLSMTP
ncbi:Ku protein [Streptomyces anulatus]